MIRRAWLGLPFVIFVFGCTQTQPHPIFRETNWVQDGEPVRDYFLNRDGTVVMWREVTFYKHPNGQWFKGEYKIFGEPVIRAYGVRDSQGILMQHWIQIKGRARGNLKWYTTVGDHPDLELIRNGAGDITAITVILKGPDGHEIARRIIQRPLIQHTDL